MFSDLLEEEEIERLRAENARLLETIRTEAAELNRIKAERDRERLAVALSAAINATVEAASRVYCSKCYDAVLAPLSEMG